MALSVIVFVVEDDELIRPLLEEALANGGFAIAIASDGEQAMCQSARERDPLSACKRGSDSMLMQFALTVSGESVGNRHHRLWYYARSVRACD